jgi:hypothetical protein
MSDISYVVGELQAQILQTAFSCFVPSSRVCPSDRQSTCFTSTATERISIKIGIMWPTLKDVKLILFLACICKD